MESFIKNIELLVLEEFTKQYSGNEFEGTIEAEYLDVVNSIVSGNHHQTFECTLTRDLLIVDIEEGNCNADLLNRLITENVSQFLNSAENDNKKRLRALVALLLGIANLKVFLEHNWVGPPLSFSPLYPNSSDLMMKLDNSLRLSFLIDGEDVHVTTSFLFHFLVAKILLNNFESHLSVYLKTSKFWHLRCLWIQQFLYEERLPSLKRDILKIITDEESNPLFCDGKVNKTTGMLFHLEACHISYFYYEPSLAKKHMELAQQISGLEISLTGALGKRTRFQQNNISQLVLQVERLNDCIENEELSLECSKGLVLPKNVSLDDEAVFDKIQLENPDNFKPISLTPVEQCLVLGLCYHHRRNKEGLGNIVKEEMMAYLNCVLSQPHSWCIESMALYMRCRCENEGTRYLHRSLSQLEELVKMYKTQTKPAINRLHWVISCMLPPHWKIEHEWGVLLDSMGLTNGALEVFERLQMWDDVIRCHAALGNKNKAEALIRSQLAIKETPLLWCYLGDITKDEECYQKAWELSNHRFSRAQRSLGYWYIGKKEFEKSLEHFEKALEINSLQIGAWFSYGCAGLSCGQYEKAAVGFRRCVNMNSDNFEAWNNLATAYIRSHNKPRAFVTLQEAIKCDYENWRIWENYLVVSVDVGQFEETMRGYHRLLDLKQKHTDVEVLSLLTKAICENLKDATGQESIRLKPKLLELFGHVTSKVTSNADIWRLYAKLANHVEPGQSMSELNREKVLQYLQKSHRCCTTLSSNWEKNIEKCIDVCKRTISLAEAYKSCIEAVHEDDQRKRIISSAKLSINAVLVLAKKNKIDFPAGDALMELDKSIEELEQRLKDIMNQL